MRSDSVSAHSSVHMTVAMCKVVKISINVKSSGVTAPCVQTLAYWYVCSVPICGCLGFLYISVPMCVLRLLWWCWHLLSSARCWHGDLCRMGQQQRSLLSQVCTKMCTYACVCVYWRTSLTKTLTTSLMNASSAVTTAYVCTYVRMYVRMYVQTALYVFKNTSLQRIDSWLATI